jgi:hypothetical protein
MLYIILIVVIVGLYNSNKLNKLGILTKKTHFPFWEDFDIVLHLQRQKNQIKTLHNQNKRLLQSNVKQWQCIFYRI